MGKRTLLASTGTIVGRINGYDVHLVTRILPPLLEAGLIAGGELMMLNSYYDRMEAVASEWKSAGIPFPVIHCEKDVGAFLSDAGALRAAGDYAAAEAEIHRALSLFRLNCEMGAMAGASRMVLHLWGGRNSDSYLDTNLEVFPRLLEILRPYGIRLLIENIPSTLADPLTNWHRLTGWLSEVGLVFDTRFGNVHRQIAETFADPVILPHIEHIHVSDHIGEKKDFSSLRPILHPGEGQIDFDAFTRLLDGAGYDGTVTLESPVIREGGADGEKLTRTVRHLHTFLI